MTIRTTHTSHSRPILEPEKPPICLEAAYYSARHDNSPIKAQEWLAGMKTGYPVERFVHLRAEPAVLYAEGNLLESAECVKEGLRIDRVMRAHGLDADEHRVASGVHQCKPALTIH